VHADDVPLPLTVGVQPTTGTLLAAGCITDTHGRALAYHCAIAPSGGAWSGLSAVVPQGWTIGHAAGQYRVCRYTSASGDAHPATYEHVDRNLMQQNFLVIRGDQSCPVAPASPLVPDGVITAAHQP
jgi:hypothetical protein